MAETRVLVTGAALRTGRAIALELAARGYTLVLHANRHFEELESLIKQLPGSGHKAVKADLGVPDEVKLLAKEAADCSGLVLNASCYRHNYKGGNFVFDAVLEQVNSLAQIELIKAFISKEKSNGGAVVAFLDQAISSNESDPYLDSRRKLWSAMKEFAVKYGKDDLRFNAIAPGPMLPPPELGDTKMVKTLPTLPLGRSVTLQDAASCTAFLLECRSLTGALLFADCGQSLVNRKNTL
ncbi:MAG: SDR family oxidoreductase [Lentisphaeria bacterium]|nr:SDR family oxidoreductase [Lentisphaeria bacterium]